MEHNPRTLFILITAVLGLSACQKANPSKSPSDSKIVVTRRSELSMSDLKIQSYGPLGLEWEMSAPHADGMTTKNKMNAKDIKISFFQKGKKSSDVTAKEGILRFESKSDAPPTPSSKSIPQDMDRLNPGDFFLRGNVVAISTDGSRLTTDWLWFDNSRELIVTTAPVKIVRDDSITRGIGLEATSNFSSVKIFDETLTIKDRGKKK